MNQLRSCIRSSIRSSLISFSNEVESVNALLATGQGVIDGDRSILLNVSSDTVIHWGDGTSTPILSSNGQHLYTKNYSNFSNPQIRIEDPENVTVFAVGINDGNLSSFVISYTDMNALINGQYWENQGSNKAILSGDIGTLTFPGTLDIF